MLSQQGNPGVFVPRPYGRRALQRPSDRGVVRSRSGAEELSVLGKFAFASLWLLVFAMPWEDAITISGFGTSVRLIGMITVGFGVMAIIERGKVRRPAPGHIVRVICGVFFLRGP